MAEQALRHRRSSGPHELLQHGRGDPQAGQEVHRVQGSNPDFQPIEVPPHPPGVPHAHRKGHQDRKEPGSVSLQTKQVTSHVTFSDQSGKNLQRS